MSPSGTRTRSLVASLAVHGSVLATVAVIAPIVTYRPAYGDRTPLDLRIAIADARSERTPEPAPSEPTPPIEEEDAAPGVDLPTWTPLAPAIDEQPPEPSALEVRPPRGPAPVLDRDESLRALPRSLAFAPPAREEPAPPAVEPPAEARAEPSPEPEPSAPAPPIATAPAPIAGQCEVPDYPASWARRGWTGLVVVELDVATDGRVVAARVVRSSGFPKLDELARSTLATWRFAPAREGHRAVTATHRQRVEFRP